VSHRLSSGDMCFIDSTVPHRFLGTGVSPYEDSRAEVIDIYWCPLGESYLFADDSAPSAEAVSAEQKPVRSHRQKLPARTRAARAQSSPALLPQEHRGE